MNGDGDLMMDVRATYALHDLQSMWRRVRKATSLTSAFGHFRRATVSLIISVPLQLVPD